MAGFGATSAPGRVPVKITAIAPRAAGDPRYLCRFATERTLSTDTADAGGNATLLSS